MNRMEAMRARHSVRQYADKPLAVELISAMQGEIDRCNREGRLHIQLVINEPKAIDSLLAHYGKFSGATNYMALVGKKDPDLDEKCGYYGEQLVLAARAMGLNTCWVALTYRKVPGAIKVDSGEKLTRAIALGYGKTQGVAHKSKAYAQVAPEVSNAPDWFKAGVEAALLAPTAMNQQKFKFALRDGRVLAKAGTGFYSKIDLGIAKYHFEPGAGKDHSVWVS